MTKSIKVGIIQQHNTENPEENRLRLAQKTKELARQGAQLVVLQELHDTLYFCQEERVENFEAAQEIPGPATDFYGQQAKECSVVLVTSLFERRMAGLYHNTAVVFDTDGSMAGKYRKMHIPDDPGYYEKYYFAPGDLGFNPIQTSLGKLGVMVCWDQWFPEAARIMALKGADVLIYPTAIGVSQEDDKAEQQRQRDAWMTVQRGHSVANNLPVVSVNRVGFESTKPGSKEGIQFWGSSFVTGPQGEILAQASETEEETLLTSLNLSHSEDVRRWWPYFRDRRIDHFGDILQRCVDKDNDKA